MEAPVGALDPRPAYYHGALLLLYIVPIILLAKKIAVPIDHAVSVLGAPLGRVGLRPVRELVSYLRS